MQTYTTARGIEVEFLPIPRALAKFHETHSTPEPPGYEVPTVGGVSEHHAHDETTLEVPGDAVKTAENIRAWQEYQQRVNDYNEKFLRICLLRGVQAHATMEDWLKEQAELELPVPEDPLKRKLEWLTDYVITTKEDYQAVIMGVMRATEVPPDLLAQVEALFRGEVEPVQRHDPVPAVLPANQSPVALQPEVRGGKGSSKTRHAAVKVR